MQPFGLYHPSFEHDACGVGFVCRLDGVARRDLVDMALSALVNLSHRGAATDTGDGPESGDGAGILLRISDPFFRRVAGMPLPPPGRYGVGTAFLPTDAADHARARALVEETAAEEGWRVLGWRDVPTRPECLGTVARRACPGIAQCFVVRAAPGAEEDDARERGLYVLRKCCERAASDAGLDPDHFHFAGLSARTVVYKGMLSARQLAAFYPDLADAELASPFAVVHQRYSTNTFPAWRLAQPLRGLAHNGEINAIRGNRRQMRAREKGLASPVFGPDLEKLFPVLEENASDSASLDNALELLLRGGRDLSHALAMVLPQAIGRKYPMGADLRGFFEFHAGLMEPWDGPAAVVATDGVRVAAALDRNGLRPARYAVTDDGLAVFASEAGVLDLPPERVREMGALRPGHMLLADPESGRLLRDADVKTRLARRRPYRRWVAENRVDPRGRSTADHREADESARLPFRQRLFGYTREDVDAVLAPMAASGREPVGSMGADTPLAALSGRPQSLFAYFRQQFAQVTNPPIDPIREALVMSLMTFIGNDPNILDEQPRQARLVKLDHPILTHAGLERLRRLDEDDFRCVALEAVFHPGDGRRAGEALSHALARLEREAEDAVRAGARLVLLSDRTADGARPPLPSLLAVAAVNRRLEDAGLRTGVGLLCAAGDARDAGQVALLLAAGASAVHPWLALETLRERAASRELPGGVGTKAAVENYVRALRHGLLKIMSKLGISTLRSYRGAMTFEAVGLGPELAEHYFPGLAARLGGIGPADLERAALAWRDDALTAEGDTAPASSAAPDAVEVVDGPESPPLPVGGRYRYRRDGERHLWTPETVTNLQRAVRDDDPGAYARYADGINRPPGGAFTLRGLLDFRRDDRQAPVPLAEVESVERIVRRFVSGAMSFGSLSREAHETLALAMNRLGARSNSGEGGEDPDRYRPDPDGNDRRSAIKQVASGRFGVTLEYLNQAGELQIKIAQGAKPGEGGQLPGHKVDAAIARVRHATPGVTLISPPPHHDIYSIEDLAQLVFDLRRANDAARVSVKLVSEAGVGTIAAGVAKARADTILIAGHDGGTGASPLSSIYGAGAPWELGLAETQQTLVANGLRAGVRLQVDGQLKTGRDVAMAALLGADEFGFATAPLVSLGCLMMRQCHSNGCPVGIATQDPELRRRFAGKPEHVIRFFGFVAEELRGIMAELGFRTVEEMIGRVDRLALRPEAAAEGAAPLDLTALLAEAPGNGARRYQGRPPLPEETPASSEDTVLDAVEYALARGENFDATLKLRNTDRAVGARISSRVARRHGDRGLPDDSIRLRLTGTAGQSFGAFAARGVTLELEGAANDHVGKGLSGGRLVVRAPEGAGYDPAASVLVGNVALYGATAGELYVGGRAGERFAVRNSGAAAVVEGVGDHGCEYMTGGRVVVLGPTGVNFAAGMSGGLAYVLDDDGLFDTRCNLDTVDLDLLEPDDEAEVRALLERHLRFTASRAAARLLADWPQARERLVKVFPTDYRRALGAMSTADAATPRRPGEAV